jgi:hypothetical protein
VFFIETSDVNITNFWLGARGCDAVLDVSPMNIGCDGIIMPGYAWETYSFAHSGASVSDFLYAAGLSNDV